MIRPHPFALALILAAAPVFAQEDHNFLSPEEKAGGWKLLFDGRTVPGLRGLQKPDFLKAGWEIKDGTLNLPKSVRQSGDVTGGDLVTSEQYGDFEFTFDFKFVASGAGGILYFARGGGAKPTGHEYQIIDDVHHPDGLKGGPLRRTGALYSVLPPSEDKRLHESDQWNSGAIKVEGNHVEHWLNGRKVLEYDCGSAALMAAVRTNKAKVYLGFGQKIKSSLAILDKGEEIAFRDLKIRSLPAPDVAPAAALGSPATPTPATPAPTFFGTPVAPTSTTPSMPAPAATPVPRTWQLPPPPPPPVIKH